MGVMRTTELLDETALLMPKRYLEMSSNSFRLLICWRTTCWKEMSSIHSIKRLQVCIEMHLIWCIDCGAEWNDNVVHELLRRTKLRGKWFIKRFARDNNSSAFHNDIYYLAIYWSALYVDEKHIMQALFFLHKHFLSRWKYSSVWI